MLWYIFIDWSIATGLLFFLTGSIGSDLYSWFSEHFDWFIGSNPYHWSSEHFD